MMSYFDYTLLELLKWMHINGHMERVVVAILSDHVLRYGDFIATHIGRRVMNFSFSV